MNLKEERTQIETLPAFRDSRGMLFEPLDDRGLAAQKNVHVVLSEPGAVRGNHSHPGSIEVTAVVGPCLVRLKESDGIRDVAVPAGETWRFTIPPGGPRLPQHGFLADGVDFVQQQSARSGEPGYGARDHPLGDFGPQSLGLRIGRR